MQANHTPVVQDTRCFASTTYREGETDGVKSGTSEGKEVIRNLWEEVKEKIEEGDKTSNKKREVNWRSRWGKSREVRH